MSSWFRRFRWPPDAQIAVKTAAAEEFGLTVTARSAAGDGYGTAAIALTPRLVHDHELTVRVSSASAAGRLISFKLTARCPTAPPVPNGPTLTTSAHNEVLCVKTGTSDPAPKDKNSNAVGLYHVTPGTLNGVLESARAAIAARSDRFQCGLTPNKLAAFMLSIGYREVQAEYAVRPDPSRSPMALSRRDVGRNGRLKNSDGTFAETVEQFHARWAGYETNRQMHLYSDDRREQGPPRAFFHPGVGLWQLDDAGDPDDGWVMLNHGQRANTGAGLNDSANDDSGGEVVASHLAERFCDDPGGVVAVGVFMKQWHACSPLKCIEVYNNIYLDGTDDLYVTTAHDAGRYSAAGGVSSNECRWSDARTATPIVCFVYDTQHPQGWTDSAIPATAARPPDTGGLGSSPYALPFVSFTHDEKRFAVFPDSILDSTEDAVDTTRYKAVPKTGNARKLAKTWSTGSYNGAVLEVRLCREPDWVVADGGSCGWVSVSDAQFASLMGRP